MGLLNNLMEWSSAQTGRIGFNPENIDLGSILNEVIGLLRDTATKKNILIFNSVSANTAIKADKHMLSSILRNLISNSIKFTNKGGTVIVQADKNAKEILISVSDNGVGMTNKMLSELFRSEVLVSTKGTDNENGSGLGLELCKEFVEKHGGKIWAESEPDKGSTFYFTIPLNMQ